MGWFNEQIRQRRQNDEEIFQESLCHLTDAVLGTKTAGKGNRQKDTYNAVEEIVNYYQIKAKEIPSFIPTEGISLEAALEPYGIMQRAVYLEKGWRKDAAGALLATRKSDGRLIALLPHPFGGYYFYDEKSGKKQKINRKNEDSFSQDALMFYKPFPAKKLTVWDLMRYIVGTLSKMDFILFAAAALAVALAGLLTPKLNGMIFSDVITSGSVQLLLAVIVFLVCVNVSILLLNGVKALLEARIATKMTLSVQAATMMRVLSLPADFFKDYSAGELSNRTRQMDTFCNLLVSSVLSAGLTALFSLVYVGQIFAYTPTLVVPALCVLLLTLLFTAVSIFWKTRLQRQQVEAAAKEHGLGYALLLGIQKIKLSGAEKRAFAKWGQLYARESRIAYDPPLFLKMNTVIAKAIPMFGSIILYYRSVAGGVSVAEYYAFNTAYAMVSGAFLALAGMAFSIAEFPPILHIVKPILETAPEVLEGGKETARISGKIELNNVTFRYTKQMPPVIDNLSLKILPGQYVAIVGATGCGKSTLMRLMLGFEKPQRGAVYYDGRDLSTLHLKTLRKKIGVVLQNGRLFSGDIFSNITISAPWLSMEDAWEAAELAGIAEDIRRMPMGMHTYISEGSGGVSGGQRQRLMIARAIAPKPRILMLDEATSALDNLTQKKVSESLDGLKCTRIVIAHRLSTIRQCDRILFLENGRIAEEGTYEELIALKGKFAKLVARQRIEK